MMMQRRVAPDESRIVQRHPVSASNGDVDAGKIFFNVICRAQHFGDKNGAAFGIRRRKIRLGHQQYMTAIAARQSSVLDVRAAKSGLQGQHFGDHQRAHADRVGGDDVFQDHSFRPGELAAFLGEKIADEIRFQFFIERERVGLGEKIRQRAGEKIDDGALVAEFDVIGDVREKFVGRERVVKFIRRAAQCAGIVAVDSHVNVDAVNLMEFADGVFVIVNDLVVLRQDAKNVLLQVNPRRNRDAGEDDEQRRQQHRAAVRRQPQIKSRVKISLHFCRHSRATE